jgi:hypothetical protein
MNDVKVNATALLANMNRIIINITTDNSRGMDKERRKFKVIGELS